MCRLQYIDGWGVRCAARAVGRVKGLDEAVGEGWEARVEVAWFCVTGVGVRAEMRLAAVGEVFVPRVRGCQCVEALGTCWKLI